MIILVLMWPLFEQYNAPATNLPLSRVKGFAAPPFC